MFGSKKSAVEKAVVDEHKRARKTAKVEGKSAKAQEKAAKAEAKEPPGLIATLTDRKTAKRAIQVVSMVGPVVAPIALDVSTKVRGYLDERRAQQLGVSPDDVGAYRGPTGPVAARIATLQAAVDDLKRRRSSDLQVVRFADAARARLADLSTATRTSASMPSGRRRATLSAIRKDLNQIDADLMTFLVGRSA